MSVQVARFLVRWVARWWNASYAAYVRRDDGQVPHWWPEPWTWGARRVNRLAIPLAAKINREATGAEMVEHGWWG